MSHLVNACSKLILVLELISSLLLELISRASYLPWKWMLTRKTNPSATSYGCQGQKVHNISNSCEKKLQGSVTILGDAE